jgi:hypothetical protein
MKFTIIYSYDGCTYNHYWAATTLRDGMSFAKSGSSWESAREALLYAVRSYLNGPTPPPPEEVEI